MKTHYNPKNNPRVIIIQKLYGKFYNEDDDLYFPKHRFKKFIKDIVLGTLERNDLILDELNNKLGDEFVLEKLDKVFQTILKAATYEFMYKPNLSINVIIKEYLNSRPQLTGIGVEPLLELNGVPTSTMFGRD